LKSKVLSQSLRHYIAWRISGELKDLPPGFNFNYVCHYSNAPVAELKRKRSGAASGRGWAEAGAGAALGDAEGWIIPGVCCAISEYRA
jgi:hypothetical protein